MAPSMSPTRMAGLVLLLSALAARPVAADVVLLDEHWVPEITANEVEVEEIDTVETGDAAQAKAGECSVLLKNTSGWPNVRFMGASRFLLPSVPPGKSEVSLWYRTDTWAGRWRLEIWAYDGSVAPAPLKVLAAALDGGARDGSLLADDTWHQARGILQATADHTRFPADRPPGIYVWLAPESGWDLRHRTFVDRVEIKVLEGESAGPAPAPARRVRPKPGAQSAGTGWIWIEGEDATAHNVPAGGAFAPLARAEQDLLSNGVWLQHHGVPALRASWAVAVAEPGRYSLWCRANGSPFRWRWGGGAWKATGDDWRDEVVVQQHAGGPIVAQWQLLGDVEAHAGKETLAVSLARGDTEVAIDCFLLTRHPFAPRGKQKPDAP